MGDDDPVLQAPDASLPPAAADPPAPPVRPSRRGVVLGGSAITTVLLLSVLAAAPAPYVVESPGPTVDTLGDVDGEPLIGVSGAPTFPTDGALRLTTVSVAGGPGTPVDAMRVVRGWLETDEAVVPQELVYPQGQSAQEREQLAAREMTTSQEDATAAALTELGYAVPATVTVAGVVPDGPSDGVLAEGDVLVAVGGTEVVELGDLTVALAAAPPGAELEVTVRRDGELRELGLVTGDDGEGGSVLGVFIDPVFAFPVDVTIRIDEIGGPSAGLMFALGIVDVLTPGALTGGVDVAGTGTITVEGEVGPIGGIRQKIAGAQRDGAAVFLVPEGNCGDVDGLGSPDLQLVRVGTLGEAVDAVTAVGEGRTDDLPSCESA